MKCGRECGTEQTQCRAPEPAAEPGSGLDCRRLQEEPSGCRNVPEVGTRKRKGQMVREERVSTFADGPLSAVRLTGATKK
jgi:hypothetical protein